MAVGYVTNRPSCIVIVDVYALGAGGGDAALKIVGVIVERRVITKLFDAQPNLVGPPCYTNRVAAQYFRDLANRGPYRAGRRRN